MLVSERHLTERTVRRCQVLDGRVRLMELDVQGAQSFQGAALAGPVAEVAVLLQRLLEV
jgi:hypothetical protein